MKTTSDDTAAFEYIIDLIYQKSRIRLHDGKQELIRSRLGKRMRHLGLDSLREYCDYLKAGSDQEELTHAIDSLTTNFTNFLREEKHFRFMVETGLPEVLARRRDFRVWSAACATGEEPYSIGFYLSEHFSPAEGWNWELLATDISTRALATAQAAVYPLERTQTIPREWLKKYFQRGVGDWEGCCRVKSAVTERVTFQQLNLLGNFSFPQSFELIFCRNVMIYFDRATQEELVNQLGRFLVPGGYLLIGHSESLNGLKLPFRCVQPSIYRKE